MDEEQLNKILESIPVEAIENFLEDQEEEKIEKRHKGDRISVSDYKKKVASVIAIQNKNSRFKSINHCGYCGQIIPNVRDIIDEVIGGEQTVL